MWKTGDRVVMLGKGIGTVGGTEDQPDAETGKRQPHFAIQLKRESVWVSMAKAAALLRAPITRRTAESLWSGLVEPGAEPDPRAWEERYRDVEAALRTHDIARQAAVLRTFYALKDPPTLGEIRAIVELEARVMDELAVVLGDQPESLVQRARAVYPAAAPRKPFSTGGIRG